MNAKQGILFCAVARNGSVLARAASCVGNFLQITNSLLDKVASDLNKEQRKMTLTQADLLFHCVSSSCGLVALAITGLEHDRAEAFTFLDAVLEKFLKLFESKFDGQIQSVGAFDMDNELRKAMERYSRKVTQSKKDERKLRNCDKISAVQSDVDELKETMVASIEVVIEHGEKLELLMGKADQLATNSITFKRAATSVQRAVWVKNMKVTIALALAVLLFLYFFVSLSCGGLSWSVCIEE